MTTTTAIKPTITAIKPTAKATTTSIFTRPNKIMTIRLFRKCFASFLVFFICRSFYCGHLKALTIFDIC